MAKFLLRGRYTTSGWQGIVREGFVTRGSYVSGLVESVGGTVEAMYFVYGEDDVMLVVDAEQSGVAAISMAVNQSGAVELSTTPLITAAEMDQARERLPEYRAPGA